MKNKKSICYIIPSTKSGGIETYLLRFLKYCNNEFDVTVLVRNKSKHELYDSYLSTGAKLVFKPLGYFNLKTIYWYYRFFKVNNFDTVCDFNANFAGIPMLLAKCAKIKNRIAFYRQGSHHFKLSWYRVSYSNFLNSLVRKHSTAIFANSKAALDYFFNDYYQSDNRFQVIKNGINLDDYYSISDEAKRELRIKLQLPIDKILVGHTGRVAPAKNHFFLLKVAQKIVQLKPHVCFILIGNDTDRLKDEIQKLDIASNIRLLGYSSNIPSYLKALDFFIFPSITEGQPNALIEAMATGLPIAASNIEPIKECLPADRQACLFDPFSITDAVNVVNYVIEGKINSAFTEHASLCFDARIQFKQFKDRLFI